MPSICFSFLLTPFTFCDHSFPSTFVVLSLLYHFPKSYYLPCAHHLLYNYRLSPLTLNIAPEISPL